MSLFDFLTELVVVTVVEFASVVVVAAAFVVGFSGSSSISELFELILAVGGAGHTTEALNSSRKQKQRIYQKQNFFNGI